MKAAERIRKGLEDRWIVVYLRILAVFLFAGGLAHLGSILGVGGVQWMTRPLYVRVADPLLLAFNVGVGWGLWQRRYWAVVGWIAGIFLLQLIPFTLFISFFEASAVQRQTFLGLLAVHTLTLGIFLVLLFRRRGS